jgi:hypothetical protein
VLKIKMDWESVLLLFSTGQGCWTSDMVKLAGEDPGQLKFLKEKGFLEEHDGIYSLTPAGREQFSIAATRSYFDEKPAGHITDEKKEMDRCRLALLLNSSFVGRWGVKDFRIAQPLTYYPKMERGELCSVGRSGTPLWKYDSTEMISEIKTSFPQDRKTDIHPPTEDIEQWMTCRGIRPGTLEIDLLFLHYCDFIYYMHKTPPASDRLKLMNADRFYMQFTRKEYYDEPITLYEDIGKFHLFLLYYRHLILPGNFDLDIHQQENINALMFVTETEEEAVRFFKVFSPIAEELVGPAKPLDIWSLSMEAIENHPVREDSHFDFFEKIGHRVAITYPSDG